MALLAVAALLWRALRIDDGSMDAATLALLDDGSGVPDECEPLVSALEGAPLSDDDEGVCASHMSAIVAACHLPYESLVGEPETLLRCSSGMQGSNGALWTRVTVQYNLYAGSIVALGSDEHARATRRARSARPRL